MTDDPGRAQNWDSADEREDTYWTPDGASIDELVDFAFADAHLTSDHDIPAEESAQILGLIAARVDDLAARFSELVVGVVNLQPRTGSVAASVADRQQLASQLRRVVEPEDAEAVAAALRDLHYAAWDEYRLLLPLSDRIHTSELAALSQRALDVWIASQQCIHALRQPLDPT